MFVAALDETEVAVADAERSPTPLPIAIRTTARMAAFMPGASPPLVRTAMRLVAMDDGNL